MRNDSTSIGLAIGLSIDSNYPLCVVYVTQITGSMKRSRVSTSCIPELAFDTRYRFRSRNAQ